MRKVREKIAIIASMVCVATSSLAITAEAGVSLPPAGNAKKGINQPFQHSYRVIKFNFCNKIQIAN